MIKVVQVCEKCEKESLSDEPSTLEINYKSKTMAFLCPKCGHANIIDFGEIKQALERKTKLPGISGSRF